MSKLVGWVHGNRFFNLIILPNLLFIPFMFLMRAAQMIALIQSALLAEGAALTIAFLLPAWEMLKSSGPAPKWQYLSLGVWQSWLSRMLQSGTIAWTVFFGSYFPTNPTHFFAWLLYLNLWAGVFHLLPAGSDFEGQVPPRRWAVVGSLIAIAVFAGVCLGYWTRGNEFMAGLFELQWPVN